MMPLLPLQKSFSLRVRGSREQVVTTPAPLNSQRANSVRADKALPPLPPAAQTDYLDAPTQPIAGAPRPAPYTDAFLRRLDRASALVSGHRTVPPLAILVAFERNGIALKHAFELQDTLTDAEIELHAHAAYDASLPKPRKAALSPSQAGNTSSRAPSGGYVSSSASKVEE